MSDFRKTPAIMIIGLVALTAPAVSWAHCDTLDGPVVADARLALAEGEVTPVLKWVRASDEAAIRSAFDHTVAVRGLGPEARELADTYFFETLVRIHRAGEGAPFTGLKPEGQVEPVIRMVDQALESGTIEELSDALTTHAARAVEERFSRAVEARKRSDESVADGRAFVSAYVDLTHYVEALHGVIAGGSHHDQHGE